MSLRTNKKQAKHHLGGKKAAVPHDKAHLDKAALDVAYIEAVAREAARRKRRHRRQRVVLVLLLFCIAATVGALVERQNLTDWWRLRNYTAPPVVAQLATQDSMTSYARKVFYVNQPNIIGGSGFGDSCPNNGGEQTIVLGCYHSSQSGIYLLNVSDPLLSGVEQVTAAHEMLHAAYERLSGSDRQRVDEMLQSYYDHDLHDARILSTIAAYQKSEPHDVVNEMHSVFGSEVKTLPLALENYYKRYFHNRGQVVANADKYQAQFTSRQTIVAQDDAALASLKTKIDNQEADLKTKLNSINNQQAVLVKLRSTNVPAYNAAVPGYNQQVDAYNSEADGVQRYIDQFNQLVISRNKVALEEDQLVKELLPAAAQLNK